MPNHLPEISIIIPTYNYGRFIGRALNSVLSQSYQDYEIIVVDDASTDDTKNIISQYTDKRIRYIRHDINRGPSAARNTGIKSSKGEFIAFLDSDDEWEPDKLYHQINLFRNASSDIGCVYCGARYVNMMTMAQTDFYPRFRGNIIEPLLTANVISGCDSTLMVRKKCFDEIGLFDEEMQSSEDWDMWLRIVQFYKIDYVNIILVTLWQHDENISTNMDRTIKGREFLLKKNENLYNFYPYIHSLQYYHLGILCYKNNFMAKGRRHFLEAFSLAEKTPLKIKSLLQFTVSFIGYPIYSRLRLKLIGD